MACPAVRQMFLFRYCVDLKIRLIRVLCSRLSILSIRERGQAVERNVEES